MYSPLVSIVIPLFNKEKYVLECLRSVSAQSYRNWECIIIDDGSTDGSVQIVRDYVNEFPGNWKINGQNNGGPASARNFGISCCTGEYIAFLDADDIWFPNKLLDQTNYFKKYPNVSLVLTNYIVFSNFSKLNLRGIRSPHVKKLLKHWLDMRGFGGLVESTGMLRSSKLTNELLFSDELKTGEGLDFVIRWNLYTEVRVLRRFLTLYRISNEQLHKQENLIQVNVETLTNIYSPLGAEGKRIRARQQAYFALSAMRAWPKVKIVKRLLANVTNLNWQLIIMAAWISSRNLRAIFLSSNTKRRCKAIFSNIDS